MIAWDDCSGQLFWTIPRDCCAQEAAREKSNLSAELLVLKDEIEALGQRKKLVSEQA